jgi:hypothetical protein
MSLNAMLPWFVSFLVMLVVLMFLIRYLLRARELPTTNTVAKDRPDQS